MDKRRVIALLSVAALILVLSIIGSKLQGNGGAENSSVTLGEDRGMGSLKEHFGFSQAMTKVIVREVEPAVRAQWAGCTVCKKEGGFP